jgi:galactose mutarotase-like enzyme
MSTTVEHATWGVWTSLRLASAALELEVVGELGARVISLQDRERDHEWLLPGSPPNEAQGRAWSAEGVTFSGRESFGWDECFPSVSVCPDPLDPPGPPLRDHGDQWGRGTYVTIDEAAGAVEHTWSVPRWPYRFARRLSFADPRTVLARYSVLSVADASLPFLWSQHPVFRLPPGSRIELPGVDRALLTWQRGISLPETVPWPMAVDADGGMRDLATTTTGEGWAAKLYVTPPGAIAALAPGGARLTLDWDRAFAPVLGVWLSYGGWPVDGPPCEQVALEPTTSPDDHLAAALAHDRSRWLQPGERVEWWVSLHAT